MTILCIADDVGSNFKDDSVSWGCVHMNKKRANHTYLIVLECLLEIIQIVS